MCRSKELQGCNRIIILYRFLRRLGTGEVMERLKEKRPKLTKEEIIFLSKVESNKMAPYSVMASNAILWRDRETINYLIKRFGEEFEFKL